MTTDNVVEEAGTRSQRFVRSRRQIPAISSLALLLTGISLVSSLEYRSYDGTNNNLEYPQWGARNSPRVRKYPPRASYFNHDDYQPWDETNSNGILPSARRVMEEIFRKAKPHKDKTLSHVMLEFGHFIVQDILGSEKNMSEPFPIPCDGELHDFVFCPVTGQHYSIGHTAATAAFTVPGSSNDTAIMMPFHRHAHTIVAATGKDEKDAKTKPIITRATINGMTPLLDLSNIYGLDEESYASRTKGGQILLGDDGLPLRDDEHESMAYKKGMNTSPGAYAMYIVFMRYHNLMAKEYEASGNYSTDDEIFEMARRKTIAVYQFIVEEKYLPTLLADKLDNYQGFNPDTDPSIDEFFAAVSFRYAHSSFAGLIRILDESFHPTPQDPLLLREVFKQDLNRIIREGGGVEPFFRGLVITAAKAIDASFVDDLSIWAEATSVLDIQRGRDIAVPKYNVVRVSFGLERMTCMEELVAGSVGHTSLVGDNNSTKNNDSAMLVAALKRLYHNNVDLVDAIVGAVIEPPETNLDNMSPLFSLSIKEQFTRLRDGDRFWYKAIFPQHEYESFPSLSEIIKAVCDGMELFPDDAFVLADPSDEVVSESTGACDASGTNQISFLGGDYIASWQVDKVDEHETTIDVTLSIQEPMEGPGYIGIGFGAREMNGADIWFCTIDKNHFKPRNPLPTECSESNAGKPMFSCCLAPGTNHNVPQCSQPGDDPFYSLDVVDWCLSSDMSWVTVRALVCSETNDDSSESLSDCFKMASTSDGAMDIIVAYNPLSQSRPHGYQRRTNAQVDLKAGIITTSEAGTADSGLIATHGVFMLFGWMVLAPWGVFIVRYLKTKKWRLVAHISIMGAVGSMMIPLLIGVEAAVGASDKTAAHSLVGLIIMGFFFVMAGSGRFRYLKWEGQKLGRRTDAITLVLHKYGGAAFIGLAWWNCYTGLVRIGPEDSNIELVLFSTYSMGYNMDIFGVIRKYVYGPYLAFVGIVFLIAEVRKRRMGNAGTKMEEGGSLWDDDGSELETMTMETFLEVTRMGSFLCVVDGRVLDISTFIETHPGGPELLHHARGCDITNEFLGKSDVNGIRHVHGQQTVLLMRNFVRARLAGSGELQRGSARYSEIDEASSALLPSFKNRIQKSVRNLLHRPHSSEPQTFRRGKVVDVQYLAPLSALPTDQAKPIILLRLSWPRFAGDKFEAQRLVTVPGCSFSFRGSDSSGNVFEREYTALLLNRENQSSKSSQWMSLRNLDPMGLSSGSLSADFENLDETEKTDSECVFDFVISLVPGGKMSTFFSELKTGKLLLAQGPRFNPRVSSKIENKSWKTVVLLAAGTGIVGMLQVIDFYLSKKYRGEVPRMFLIWVLESPAANYHEVLGLKDRVSSSKGQLKWVTVYSRSVIPSENRTLDRLPTKETDNFGSSTTTYSGASYLAKLKRLFRNRESLKVRDLIAYAQRNATYPGENPTAPASEQLYFDNDFFRLPIRSITRHVDKEMVQDLAVSIQEYCQQDDDKGTGCGSFSDDTSESSVGENFEDIARALQSTMPGIDSNVSDTSGLMTRKGCFAGKTAVDYLVSLGYTSSRKDAVRMGEYFQELGFLQHVSLDHGFSDDDALFRFTLPEASSDGVIGTSSDSLSGEDVPTEEWLDNSRGARLSSVAAPAAEPAHNATKEQQNLPLENDNKQTTEPQLEKNKGDVDIQVEPEAASTQASRIGTSFDNTLYVLSGPPLFEVSMMESLISAGVPRGQTMTFTAGTTFRY